MTRVTQLVSRPTLCKKTTQFDKKMKIAWHTGS